MQQYETKSPQLHEDEIKLDFLRTNILLIFIMTGHYFRK